MYWFFCGIFMVSTAVFIRKYTAFPAYISTPITPAPPSENTYIKTAKKPQRHGKETTTKRQRNGEENKTQKILQNAPINKKNCNFAANYFYADMIQPHDKITGKIAMQLITNISISTANRYIAHCKKHLNKNHEQILTVEEFCQYFGIHL